MKWLDIKWIHLLVGFVATLALLFVLHIVWQRAGIERPLVQILEQDPAVRSVQVVAQGRGVNVIIELGEVERLAEVIIRLSSIAHKTQTNIRSLKFSDNSTPELDEAYYGLHMALYEGISTGHYVDMSDRVRQHVMDLGLHYSRLEIDQSDIYLQLHSEGGYLYRVVPLKDGDQ